MFRNSHTMKHRGFAHDMPSIKLEGVTMPWLLSGDPPYPPQPGLMNPFMGWIDALKELLINTSALTEWLWNVQLGTSKCTGGTQGLTWMAVNAAWSTSSFLPVQSKVGGYSQSMGRGSRAIRNNHGHSIAYEWPVEINLEESYVQKALADHFVQLQPLWSSSCRHEARSSSRGIMKLVALALALSIELRHAWGTNQAITITVPLMKMIGQKPTEYKDKVASVKKRLCKIVIGFNFPNELSRSTQGHWNGLVSAGREIMVCQMTQPGVPTPFVGMNLRVFLTPHNLQPLIHWFTTCSTGINGAFGLPTGTSKFMMSCREGLLYLPSYWLGPWN